MASISVNMAGGARDQPIAAERAPLLNDRAESIQLNNTHTIKDGEKSKQKKKTKHHTQDNRIVISNTLAVSSFSRSTDSCLLASSIGHPKAETPELVGRVPPPPNHLLDGYTQPTALASA